MRSTQSFLDHLCVLDFRRNNDDHIDAVLLAQEKHLAHVERFPDRIVETACISSARTRMSPFG
jgi:hypothetical protein